MSPPPAWSIDMRSIALRATLYILFIAAITHGAYLEAHYLPDVRFTEYGFSEPMQTLILASCSLMLLYVRHCLKVFPTVALLLFAFVTASLIREQDYFLDTFVARNVWKILVALVIIPSLIGVWRQRRRFMEEFVHYSNTCAFGLFAAGFLTTYVFSRLYGRQSFWRAVLEDEYVRVFKDAAEEVVELLGYSLILFATIELLLLARRIYRARQLEARG